MKENPEYFSLLNNSSEQSSGIKATSLIRNKTGECNFGANEYTDYIEGYCHISGYATVTGAIQNVLFNIKLIDMYRLTRNSTLLENFFQRVGSLEQMSGVITTESEDMTTESERNETVLQESVPNGVYVTYV